MVSCCDTMWELSQFIGVLDALIPIWCVWVVVAYAVVMKMLYVVLAFGSLY